MSIDWADVLAKVSLASLAQCLSSLELPLQQHIVEALQQRHQNDESPSPPPSSSPWSVGAGSVAWLLEECQLTTLYGETFAEYGLGSVQELIHHGRDAMQTLLRDLGVTRDHRDKLERLAFSPRPCGASGGAFDAGFLRACRPLHVQHMGCENMGPLLYALTRFVKPLRVLEVGAGYTSLWLLRALADNDAELEACSHALAADGYKVSSVDWMVDDLAPAQLAHESAGALAGSSFCSAHHTSTLHTSTRHTSTLHTIDDMGAAEGGNRGSAHLVREIAEQLGLCDRLRLHEGDAYALASDAAWLGSCGSGDEEGAGAARACPGAQPGAQPGSQPGSQLFDMMWLDFGLGTGSRIESFLDAWWARLRPGGLLLLHSTLTNAVTRQWLEAQRERLRPHACPGAVPGTGMPAAAAEAPVLDDLPSSSSSSSSIHTHTRSHLLEYETLSLLEPHKRYQNSVSIFQKRDGGWAEPVHTMYP